MYGRSPSCLASVGYQRRTRMGRKSPSLSDTVSMRDESVTRSVRVPGAYGPHGMGRSIGRTSPACPSTSTALVPEAPRRMKSQDQERGAASVHVVSPTRAAAHVVPLDDLNERRRRVNRGCVAADMGRGLVPRPRQQDSIELCTSTMASWNRAGSSKKGKCADSSNQTIPLQGASNRSR